ncbi:MAG: hypothetical protein ACRD68_05030 [Pyrinomonadaceae bacterium]
MIIRTSRLGVFRASLLIGLLLVPFTVAPAQQGVSRRVRFPRGRSSVTIKGAVVRGTADDYLLGARSGQKMTVRIKSVEGNAVFNIYRVTEEGDSVIVAESTNWNGALPEDGDYRIEVGPTRGNATYTLYVTIR